nr:substrate binding domain-containing protein [Vibrio sonorensis]
MEGRITITAPINMTQAWLKECLFSFAAKFPNITLDVQLQNEKVDLVDAQVDIAFRVGDELAQDWVARNLWSSPYGLVAHQSYLDQYGDIRHPSELDRHKLVSVSSLKNWSMTEQSSGEKYTIQGPYLFESNDVLVVREAVSYGMGIGWMPPYYFNNPSHANSGLVSVLPEWLGQARPIKLLYRDRDMMPARIQVFIQHVLEWKSLQTAPYASL